MIGGYVMVDCSGVDLGNLAKVDGLYDRVKTAIGTDKPIVLKNLVNDTQKFSPIVAYGGVENSTTVFLSFYPVTLHIASDDTISY